MLVSDDLKFIASNTKFWAIYLEFGSFFIFVPKYFHHHHCHHHRRHQHYNHHHHHHRHHNPGDPSSTMPLSAILIFAFLLNDRCQQQDSQHGR